MFVVLKVVMNRTNIFSLSKIDEGGYNEVLSACDMLSLYTKENISAFADLENSILLLKEREQCLKEQEVKCSHELKELEEQQKHVHEEAALLKERVKSLKVEHWKLNDECKVAERRKQPSSKDTQILQKHKKKLKLYKNLIGLKWDYTAATDSSVGYVFNPTTNGVKPFAFDNSYSADKIWLEIKAIAKPDWEKIK